MKALFVAYQDPASRRWAPVGQLSRKGERYHFAYTRGAQQIGNFVPFGRMTDLNIEYVSESLFPLFANRVLPRSRPEYDDYLRWLGLTRSSYDALEELARTGGLRATDTLELFPCPSPIDGRYQALFFVRGLRHMTMESQDRAQKLNRGERLYLCRDIQNGADGTALLLRTGEPATLLGYTPRYYSRDFSDLIEQAGANSVSVTVEQVSTDAPTQHRVLCNFSAPWPAGFAPCTSEEFESLATTRNRLAELTEGHTKEYLSVDANGVALGKSRPSERRDATTPHQ
jgi:hypothetical protein